MAQNLEPTPDQLERREALLSQVRALTAFLDPDTLTRLYALRGLAYAELLELKIDTRDGLAEVVGLSAKAVDWGKAKAKGYEGQMGELSKEFVDLLTSLAETLRAVEDSPAARSS
jgi:hypothetical protein